MRGQYNQARRYHWCHRADNILSQEGNNRYPHYNFLDTASMEKHQMDTHLVQRTAISPQQVAQIAVGSSGFAPLASSSSTGTGACLVVARRADLSRSGEKRQRQRRRRGLPPSEGTSKTTSTVGNHQLRNRKRPLLPYLFDWLVSFFTEFEHAIGQSGNWTMATPPMQPMQ
mmetsp:Transcript_11635/g.25214  ORF Transcript_11635/g.25214 Transcript_11635/m.25214 type:complete len:171 (-) Transcript_11635:3-515(-)